MFPRTIKNVNTWYFHTKTSTPIDCLSTYFYWSLVRKNVCFGLYIDKTCVPDVFSESPLNTDTRIIRTVWHVPLHVGVRINRVTLWCIVNVQILSPQRRSGLHSGFTVPVYGISHLLSFFCHRFGEYGISWRLTKTNWSICGHRSFLYSKYLIISEHKYSLLLEACYFFRFQHLCENFHRFSCLCQSSLAG